MPGGPSGPALPHIVTLNSVLTEVAREIGGDQASVTGLVPPDVDPHTFEPSAADIRTLVQADLVLASGLHLETYLDRIAANAGAVRVIAVGDALPAIALLALPANAPGEKDPHWWHSIDNMILATEVVRVELSRLRPGAAAAFAGRAQAYEKRLSALRAWTVAALTTLPPERRQLVTSHDAFGYFARDYSFVLHAINGLSTEGEPDARHLARLIDLIRRERIQAVFVENSVNPRLVENLVGETGVHLGGALYADGLGSPASDAATYEAMMRHNVRTIVAGLK